MSDRASCLIYFVNDIFDIFDRKECCHVNLHNKPISCLMYADDLLIFSETEDGLTECLIDTVINGK